MHTHVLLYHYCCVQDLAGARGPPGPAPALRPEVPAHGLRECHRVMICII